MGLPCAVLPGDESLWEILQREEAGFALSGDPAQAAGEIEQILADRESRQLRGAAGARSGRALMTGRRPLCMARLLNILRPSICGRRT